MRMLTIKPFDVFFDSTAAVRGQRREGGVTRQLSLTVPCCVLEGELIEVSDRSVGASQTREIAIEIKRSDWPDHYGPQRGDVITIKDYGEMRIKNQPHVSATTFVAHCLIEGERS